MPCSVFSIVIQTFRMQTFSFSALEITDDVMTFTVTDDELDLSVQQMVQLRKMVDTNEKKNILEAQKRQKQQYDARHKKEEYKVIC